MTIRLSVPTVLLALLVTAFSIEPTDSSMLGDTWEANEGTLVVCSGCNYGSPHSFLSGTLLRTCDDSEVGCHAETFQGTCSEWHGDCGSELMGEVTSEASAMLKRGDIIGLRTLLREHADRVIYNADRLAIQFKWCDRASVAAHIPVTGDQMAALTE